MSRVTPCILLIVLIASSAASMTISDFIDDGKDPVLKIYKKVDMQCLRMLIVNPDGLKAGDKRPAVVWIHGGGWTNGFAERYIPHCRYTAWQGGVGISISYRLLTNPDMSQKGFMEGYSIADSLSDCQSAIQYIRQNADQLGIDPDRIAVVGDSAGGHLALCMGILDGPPDSKPNAIVNCNGINDMTKSPWIKFIKPGQGKNDRDAKAKAFSPLYNLKKGQPPILTMNGDNDNVVPPADSEAFHQACLAVGIDSEYILWPAARHAFIVPEYTASDAQITKAMLAIDRFLIKHRIFEKKVVSVEKQEMFEQITNSNWKEVFHDSCKNDWRDKWFLDGQKAKVTNSGNGMNFFAGPTIQDMNHAVMWTKESFEGDVKIEYIYTRLDKETRCVNILYIQATGFGKDPFVEDIYQWHDIRDAVPSMSMYFNYMDTYHISYAAWDNNGTDYIRLRRYMPDEGLGLGGTSIEPDNYTETGLFATGVPHKITVIKRDNHIFMQIENAKKTYLCHWENTKFPQVLKGRIGLRHMYTRGACYKDFKIYVQSCSNK